ncbi:glutathione S-transferase family protein [Litorilituus sediminis]|uniref:Glutathione S-transferase family protein n=1 Tax=Litorilituus sediminis TaxID=718192 RepID=A0A4P6P7T1_9GAMM|nr:glutathione S-transferase family protein [Litorilituus sediminis]QBG35515.1 glutathione S-transferase family protein [Litorilituus sediminis]
MKLIGSITSPYVRRIRLYLASLQHHDYQFINLDIFSPNDREVLTENNPAQKVPALVLDNNDSQEVDCIYDSRVIFRYLQQHFNQEPLTWQQENLLTLIDAANDSFVSLLLSTRSGHDVKDDKLFFNLQRERIETVLTELEKDAAKQAFSSWSYPSICLFCLLDWIRFRALYDVEPFPHLSAFYQQSLQGEFKLIIEQTDPRQ